jgi:hypothetical protein
VVERRLDPRSKLATARGLDPETLTSTLGEVLGLGRADADDLYAAMAWLLPQQARIEQALARPHLTDGSLVLYDVTSTSFEGRTCLLARYGHSRDGRRDTRQIVFGLLTNGEGCPVAVEAFAGHVGDPKTLPAQIQKLRTRFGIARVGLVGDRGMLTEARLRADLQPIEGLDWITALRAPAIQALRSAGPGRDHAPRLSRRAADRLQEPLPGRGARAQAPGAPGGDGAGPGRDHRRHPARPAAAPRPGAGRPPGRQGPRAAQGRQALHA